MPVRIELTRLRGLRLCIVISINRCYFFCVRIELTRLRGLRQMKIVSINGRAATLHVRIELTRLRGLRPLLLKKKTARENSVRIELTRLRGLRLYRQVM